MTGTALSAEGHGDVLYGGLWDDAQSDRSLRLLTAALEEFATHGFAGSTTRPDHGSEPG